MDCVRTALREDALKVICAYRRDEKSMPGSKKEFFNSKEEGAEFIFNVAPKKIITKNSKVTQIELVKTEIKDKKVVEIEGSNFTIDADILIFALGFSHQPLDFLNGFVELDEWGGIKVNKNYQTTHDKIYAGGDAIRGADLVVTAARDGREASKAIIEKLLK